MNLLKKLLIDKSIEKITLNTEISKLVSGNKKLKINNIPVNIIRNAKLND